MLSVRALLATVAIAAAALALPPASANAAGRDAYDLQLSCEQGRNYLIRPRAISIAGELVTGYLLWNRRGGHYVRLIPMGNGYRYAGRGIWLDGKGSVAELHLGKNRILACTVSPVA